MQLRERNAADCLLAGTLRFALMSVDSGSDRRAVGRVIAKGLHGDAVREAVQQALDKLKT